MRLCRHRSRVRSAAQRGSGVGSVESAGQGAREVSPMMSIHVGRRTPSWALPVLDLVLVSTLRLKRIGNETLEPPQNGRTFQ